MSTNDVPGKNPSNNDVLAMGCWAESSDGSLIFVESFENGRVIYSMFDAATDPVTEYRDALPEKDFKAAFSWQADRSTLKDTKASGVPTDIKWTWHDKTPFPWDRVIKKGARDGLRYASAADHLSDARRVAESLALRAERFSEDRAKHMTESIFPRIGGIIRKIGEALEGLDKK